MSSHAIIACFTELPSDCVLPCAFGISLEDDKYAKAAAKNASGPLSKYTDLMQAMRLQGFTDMHTKAILKSTFVLYASFLVAVGALYHVLGGHVSEISLQVFTGYLSAIAEALGLLLLRHKIKSQSSVQGISGMSIIMYVLVYVTRGALMLPDFTLQDLDAWAVQIIAFCSLLMVCDVLRSVFRTYRKSYQADLDTFKITFLIPGCIIVAALLHPSLPAEGPIYSYCWTVCLYMDVLALMPQVVMMANGGGKVEAPIAHFVAATAFSRSVDLWFWYWGFDMVRQPGSKPSDFNFSGWLIVVIHIVHLLLVTDFMYYYLKARLQGASFTEDIDVADVIV